MNQAIYVMQGTDRTKVGISKSPKIRRSALCKDVPGLTIVYSGFPGKDNSLELERRAHEILDRHRIIGEYFSVDAQTAVSAVLQAASELGFTLTDHEDDTSPLLIRVPAPMKAAIKKAADGERRSVSNLVEHVMAEWLQQKAKRKK